MPKNKTLSLPFEPIADVPEEEPRSVRLKRYFWLLGAAVMAIVILVLGLSKNSPPPTSPETVSEGANSPDAIIEKFHLVSTVEGQKRWEFFSDMARLYQNQKEAYSDNIYAQYYKKEKLISTLTADSAIVNTETNATQAQGHVELIVENGSKLETDKLNWDPATDQIKTDGPVHVFKGMDDITAVGLIADTQLNNIRFNKDVRTQVRDTSEVQNFSKPKPF
ncbi:MAG TPA: LPS export ABC transporter periplasmic protein LptC [bacterium]|jgi:LPS export ABC transporter protein LptC|nr:LPS export ABC transporter periplasmic protein LptC [bacterium]